MRRYVIRTIVVLLMMFGVFQLVRPAKTNPPTDRTRTLQASVAAVHPAVPVIERACQNCHSNDTEWPWYSQVAPVSWLIVHDVAEARSAVNFSDWAAYDNQRQRKILKESCEEVSEREMPLRSYTLMHPETTLSSGDVRAICDLARVYSPQAPFVEIEPISYKYDGR